VGAPARKVAGTFALTLESHAMA